MEMPIQIFITLFVLIIVGSLVVFFSQGIIDDSRSNIRKMGNAETEEDKILDVSSVNAGQIAGLAQECYNRDYGQNLNSETCFIIHSENSYTPSKSEIESSLKDPVILGEVEQSTAKTFYIIWIPEEGKVAVRT